MKPCDKHWDMMRAAVEARGLTPLIKSAKENHAVMVAELEGEPAAVSDYDPLMSMYWMVMNEAMRIGGLYLLMKPEDGTDDYCPICEAVKNGVPENAWIDGPADAALKHCVDSGLIPKH